MNKIFTQVKNKPDLDRQMSYRWLRQLTRRDLKPFASNQEDRNVNIDPWESPPAQAKSCANAPLCTLVFGNGPQLRLMFRLCFDKDRGSKNLECYYGEGSVHEWQIARADVDLYLYWGVQLRSLIIIHEVSLHRVNVYISAKQQGGLDEHNT